METHCPDHLSARLVPTYIQGRHHWWKTSVFQVGDSMLINMTHSNLPSPWGCREGCGGTQTARLVGHASGWLQGWRGGRRQAESREIFLGPPPKRSWRWCRKKMAALTNGEGLLAQQCGFGCWCRERPWQHRQLMEEQSCAINGRISAHTKLSLRHHDNACRTNTVCCTWSLTSASRESMQTPILHAAADFASSISNISSISHNPPQTAAGTRLAALQRLPSKSV